MKPSPEDMARDLAADLVEFDDLSREAGIGLAFGPDQPGAHVDDVYDMARLALVSLRIAIVRALAAEAEVARLQSGLDFVCEERDSLESQVNEFKAQLDYPPM